MCVSHDVCTCLPHDVCTCLPRDVCTCLPHDVYTCLPHDVCTCLPRDVGTCLPHDVCTFYLTMFVPVCLTMSVPVCFTMFVRISVPYDVCTRVANDVYIIIMSASLCLYAARVSLTTSVSTEHWCPARPTCTPSPPTLCSTCTASTLTDWTWTGNTRQTEEVPPETSSTSQTF